MLATTTTTIKIYYGVGPRLHTQLLTEDLSEIFYCGRNKPAKDWGVQIL